MAKYMLIMRTTDEAVAAMGEVSFDEMVETMGRYNDQLTQAGVLVAAEGLEDAANGVVVDFTGERPVVTDGPYGETRELFGGYYILDVATREEAVEWAKRMPLMSGSKCEIRRVGTMDDFPQDEQADMERTWRERTGRI